MTARSSLLPREAVALVQHVELNKAGWWERTVHRLVLASVWLGDEPPALGEIQLTLQKEFKLALSVQKLTSVLDSLEGRGMLLRLPNASYRIPDAQRAIFEAEVAESEKAERDAKIFFAQRISEVGEGFEPDQVWIAFEQDFIGPLIKQVGVNAYLLVTGERMTFDGALLQRFLKTFPSDLHQRLTELVTDFLDPTHDVVRTYIGRMLHARFCVEASGLPEHVLKALSSSVGKQIRFQLFVDTNFLFSLLELHENPSNSAAQELRDLVAQLKGNPRVELVITPETIEEAKHSIAYTKEQLNGLPSGISFTNAALHGGFSGMATRFLTERLRRGGQLTAGEWFDPYLKDFVPISRGKGVELFDVKLDEYSTRQDVIDDIHVVFKFEERLPENRRKSYPKVAHDMVLWHFVNDRRPAYVESPIDAVSWILTVDFRFIGFDEHKQKHSKSKVPLCIHPTSLIQLLQFWVPRTKEFEEAILGSLRLPFLFQSFDVEGERTSLRILKGIGRFDGSEGLSQDTIVQVMLNDGLRSRLKAEQSEDAEVELIRDALVEDMRRRAEEGTTRARLLEEEIRRRDDQIELLANSKSAAEAEKSQTLRDKAEAERAANTALASRLAELNSLKSKVSDMEESERARVAANAENELKSRKVRGLLVYVSLLLLVCGASVASAWWLEPRVPQLSALIGIQAGRGLVGIIVFIFCHLSLELSLGRGETMSALWPFKQVVRFRSWLWSLVILGFVLGVIGNLVANRIQQNLDGSKANVRPIAALTLRGTQ